MELPGTEESNISANLNQTTSARQSILNPQNILKTMSKKLEQIHFWPPKY